MDTLVIAANLGHLKAFRVLPTPTRGRKLELAEELDFPEAHNRMRDKVTDSSGRFSATTGAGPGVQIASAEAPMAELETQRRLIKLVAERIESVLYRERPEYWHFAATAEVHNAILEAIAPSLREHLVRSVHADLTKIPTAEVLDHFR